MTVEHMGARNYEAVPRPGGRPGQVLVPTGKSEPNSLLLRREPRAQSRRSSAPWSAHDLRGTIALRGADLPGPHIPMHQSFGGEGGPYHKHLVPTVAFVTGSWTLFNTAFGIDEVLDRDLLRQQTLVFADILHNIETLPREALAGGYLAQREARNVFCATALADADLATARAGSAARRPSAGG